KLLHLRAWNKWHNKSEWESFRENIIPFDVTKINEDRWQELCDLIVKKRVVAVRGYASSLDLLAQYVVKNDIRMPDLKIMIAVSEFLYDSTREMISTRLNCPVISQYSNEENGVLGQERISEGKHSPFYLN